MNEQQILQVPIPKKTDSYSPVPHKDVIEEIQENLDKLGLSVKSKGYRTNKKGTQVVGNFDVGASHDLFDFRLAFRNSYDKSMSLAFVAGVSVMICSNGMIVGDTKFVRKHTGSVLKEMRQRVGDAIKDFHSVMHQAGQDAYSMNKIDLDDTAVAELCGRFFMEQEIITSSQLNIIKDELKSPSFEDFEDQNLWSLYNHTTYALKKTHPTKYLDKHQDLHQFVTSEYSIT